MTTWMPGRIFALFLGLWVALAPAAIAVPAAAMNFQSSMCDDLGAGGCDACPDAQVDRALCTFICLSVAQLAFPSVGVGSAAVFRQRYWLGKVPPLSGRLPTPDPAPPKLLSLL